MVSCLDYLDKLELLLSVIGLARREIKAFCANFSHDQYFSNSNKTEPRCFGNLARWACSLAMSYRLTKPCSRAKDKFVG